MLTPDYFHVIQELNRHLTQIRIAAMKTVHRQREITKKEMDYKNLLDVILKSDEELKEAYQLKNEITYFYEHATVGTALEKLNTLIQWFLNARSQNFRIFAKTLMKWKKEIINSFIVLKQEYYIDAATDEEKRQEKKMTNAIIENKNTIIKCVKKYQ